MKLMKTIIILGSNYSGSSAIFDYLSGRNDILDPFKSKELFIVESPYGILPFMSTVYDAIYPPVATEALDKLEWMLNRAAYPYRGFTCGYDLNNAIPKYQEKVQKYIESITEVHYTFRNQHFMLIKPWWKCLITSIAELFSLSNNFPQQRLPVSKEQFLAATKEFLHSLSEEIIQDNPDATGMVIEQAGSYWCPEKSLEIFNNAYVIKVSRDPRDQYISFRVSTGMKDVKTFVHWYKNIMAYDSIQTDRQDPHIKRIRFEDFVRDHECEREQLCSFLKIDPTVQSSYQPERSVKRIGKYKNKNLLSTTEIKFIEDELEDYIVE